MSAVEAMRDALSAQNGFETTDGSLYFGSAGTVQPGKVVDALKAAGFAVIEIPSVAHKGPHDTDAMFFRQVADRMETPSRVDFLSGSNVRDAVRKLLYRAADSAEATS